MPTTLGLAMIVRDEEEVLKRCLDSCAELFDEIHIVDTGSIDKTIQIAQSFPNVKVDRFKWIDDFSAARNYSFSLCESDYIMWLDADDTIKAPDLERLKQFKTEMGKYDGVLLPYEYAHDEFDNSVLTLFRHRIVKRSMGYMWQDPIHEFILVPAGANVIKETMAVHHYRTAEGIAKDASRNLKMLDNLVGEGGEFHGRNLFYYSKELYYAAKFGEAVEELEKYLKPEIHDWIDNKYGAFGLLAECYRKIEKYKEALVAAKRAVKEAPGWVDGYLETASAYEALGRRDEAAQWFERATLIGRPDTLAPLINDKYSWIPHQQLVFLYDRMGKHSQAYLHCTEVSKHRPDDPNNQHNLVFLAGQVKRTFPWKIGWWDDAVESWGPARLRQFMIRESLGRLGVQTDLVSLEDTKDCQIVIRRWADTTDVTGIKKLQEKDIKVVLDLCEDLLTIDDFRGPLIEAVKVADLVVCCSMALSERFQEYNPNIVVVGDPFENPDDLRVQYDRSGELTAVFCGYGGSYRHLKPYEDLIHECGYRILTIHEHDEEYGDESLKWGADSFVEQMARADIAIVAADYQRQPSKSNNRVTQAMSLGLPVVCSPLGAYEEVIRHGVNGFLFSDGEGLKNTLLSLKDPALRKRVGKRAEGDMLAYSPDAISGCWLAHLHKAFSPKDPGIRVNLGIVPLPDWDNRLPASGDGWRAIEDLGLGVDRVSHLHMSYVLEHYPQEDIEEAIKTLSAAVQDTGKATIIFTDADLAIKDYTKGGLTWPALARRFFQKGDHQSIISLDYMVGLLRKHGFQEVFELDLAGFPFTIVPDVNNPKPEPLQSGVICWKSRQAREEDSDNCFIKSEIPGREIPTVDLVIPIYNQLEYTRLCIDSILECTDIPYTIIPVDAGSTDPDVRSYLEDLRDQDDRVAPIFLKKAVFSEAVNAGIKSGKSPYVCIMNNDVIVSRGWLSKMVESCGSSVATVDPWSNCDYGWKHLDKLEVDGVDLHPDMSIDDVREIIPRLYETQYHNEPGTIELPSDSFNAFYCTLIPRKLFAGLGYLDESFVNGGEDADWCYRASMKGYKHIHRKDCFVFHFGARTRKSREKENHKGYHEEDKYNSSLLRRKWEKPRLTIFTGRGWERWTPKSVDEGGIGGSETACVKIADGFNKLGYEVSVFNDCGEEGGDYNGVSYRNWDEYPKWASMNHTDILVVSRLLDPFDIPICTNASFCWVHDIWVSPNKVDLKLSKVDKFLCLSPWHKQFFADHQGCPLDKIAVTTNGIDPGKFADLDWDAKHPNRFIYSSSPDRGLDCLLEMWPEIRERYPDAELHVFYGFFNWMSSIKQRDDQNQLRWAQNVLRLLKQPGVENHDRVGQKELAEWYKSASVWLMPEPFTETNCITAKEAMAAGCMPICSDVAALETTVGTDRGIIIPLGPWRDAYSVYKQPEIKRKFLEATFKFLESRDDYQELLERNRNEMLNDFSWDAVAKSWHDDHFSRALLKRG